MKKNYNIPAIEVVTLVSGMIMQTGSPVQDPANPYGAQQGGSEIP